VARQYVKKTVRIQDLAEKLNISASTVSRALNNHPLISEETKKKVFDVALEYGYQPAVSSLMADSEIKTIAIVIPNSHDDFYRKITQSIQSRFHQKKYAVLVGETKYDPVLEKEYFNQLVHLKVNGIIYIAHEFSEQSLKYVVNRSFPLVIIHNDELLSKASHVMIDVYQSLKNTIEHLKKNNASSIAFVANNIQNHVVKKMASLLPEILEEYGLSSEPNANLLENMESDAFTSVMVEQFLSTERIMPDAMIFGSQEIALRFQNVLKTYKVDPPLILSVGNDRFGSFAKPRISYIDLNADMIGEEAAELLESHFDKKANPNTRIVMSGLVIKGSTIRF